MSDDESSQFESIEYHKKSFWTNFYLTRNKSIRNINWYFDITKIKIDNFSLNNLSKDEAMLLIGPGLSSILDYLNNNNYDLVMIVDFCEELINILSERYNNSWEIMPYDITKKEFNKLSIDFGVILDKGCLDCILLDKKEGEKNFIYALNIILKSLKANGVFYYFSDAKLEDRISLFQKVPKIQYTVTIIDLNKAMKEEYKEFNYEDNLYYLYTITREP